MDITATNPWVSRKRIAARVLLALVSLISALLVYPWIAVPVAVIGLFRYRAYELLLTGVILDALLAPGNGLLGDYTYTATLIAVGGVIHVVHRVMYGSTRS
jgi:hypothetical protein